MNSWKLFTQALYFKRYQLLAYCFIGLGFLLLYLAVFPTVQQQATDYNKILESMPKGLVAALNISNTAPDLMGFLASKHFGFVWALMIVLLAVAYGSFAIAKEIETKTMGLLLLKPVSRLAIYASRLFAGIAIMAVFILASEIAVWPLAHLFGYAIDGQQVMLIGTLGFLFGSACLSLAMMVSSFVSSAGRVSMIAGGILLVMYALFLIASLMPELDWLKYTSLFHYFSPGSVEANGFIAGEAIWAFVFTVIVTSFVGIVTFGQRDIQV